MQLRTVKLCFISLTCIKKMIPVFSASQPELLSAKCFRHNSNAIVMDLRGGICIFLFFSRLMFWFYLSWYKSIFLILHVRPFLCPSATEQIYKYVERACHTFFLLEAFRYRNCTEGFEWYTDNILKANLSLDLTKFWGEVVGFLCLFAFLVFFGLWVGFFPTRMTHVKPKTST